MTKVSIIISVDGSYELNNNFFEHLLNIGLSEEYEIIVVADGISNTFLIQYLKELASERNIIKLLFLDNKSGYAFANNHAVKSSTGSWLIFLNNDVFPEYGAIEKMIRYLETNRKVGVVQGLLLYSGNKRVQSTGHIFGSFFNNHALEGRDCAAEIVNQIQERQGLTSAFYGMRKELFLDQNGFDEFYYNAWEGLDLSLGVNRSGYKCIYYPYSIAYHIKGATRKVNVSNEMQQIAYFWNKWGNYIKPDINKLFKLQLTSDMRDSHYLIIDSTGISTVGEMLTELHIDFDHLIVIRNRTVGLINFYDHLSYSIKRFEGALLFFVPSMAEVRQNNTEWIATRNNGSDVLLDLKGNLLKLNDLNPF